MTEPEHGKLPTQQYIFNQPVKYRFPTHTNLLLMGRENSQIAEVYLVDYEAGESTHIHQHEDVEQLFYILEGEGVVQFGEESEPELEIRPGDLVRTPVGISHRVINRGTGRLRYLCIDCCLFPKEGRETSWDEYVHSYCDSEGWDFEQVHQGN